MHPITSTDILSILAIFQLPICAYAGLITQTSFHPTTILKQSDTNSVLGIPNAIIPEGVSLDPTSFDPASANHRSPPATDEFVNDLDTVHDIDTIRGRRLLFITSGVSGVESISAWWVITSTSQIMARSQSFSKALVARTRRKMA